MCLAVNELKTNLAKLWPFGFTAYKFVYHDVVRDMYVSPYMREDFPVVDMQLETRTSVMSKIEEVFFERMVVNEGIHAYTNRKSIILKYLPQKYEDHEVPMILKVKIAKKDFVAFGNDQDVVAKSMRIVDRFPI